MQAGTHPPEEEKLGRSAAIIEAGAPAAHVHAAFGVLTSRLGRASAAMSNGLRANRPARVRSIAAAHAIEYLRLIVDFPEGRVGLRINRPIF